jgi:hypothetical protein
VPVDPIEPAELPVPLEPVDPLPNDDPPPPG